MYIYIYVYMVGKMHKSSMSVIEHVHLSSVSVDIGSPSVIDSVPT